MSSRAIKIHEESLYLYAVLFPFLWFQLMQLVLEKIAHCPQFRQENIDSLRFSISEQSPELTLIVPFLRLYGFQHLPVFLIFLSVQQYKLILLPISILDNLIQVLRPVIQSFNESAHLCFFDGSPGIVLDDDPATRWLDQGVRDQLFEADFWGFVEESVVFKGGVGWKDFV